MQFPQSELLFDKCLTTGIHPNTCDFHFIRDQT